jgi:hypothetical protein
VCKRLPLRLPHQPTPGGFDEKEKEKEKEKETEETGREQAALTHAHNMLTLARRAVPLDVASACAKSLVFALRCLAPHAAPSSSSREFASADTKSNTATRARDDGAGGAAGFRVRASSRALANASASSSRELTLSLSSSCAFANATARVRELLSETFTKRKSSVVSPAVFLLLAQVFSRMLTYAHVCSHACSRMLAHVHAC